jgi:hypothetical protein
VHPPVPTTDVTAQLPELTEILAQQLALDAPSIKLVIESAVAQLCDLPVEQEAERDAASAPQDVRRAAARRVVLQAALPILQAREEAAMDALCAEHDMPRDTIRKGVYQRAKMAFAGLAFKFPTDWSVWFRNWAVTAIAAERLRPIVAELRPTEALDEAVLRLSTRITVAEKFLAADSPKAFLLGVARHCAKELKEQMRREPRVTRANADPRDVLRRVLERLVRQPTVVSPAMESRLREPAVAEELERLLKEGLSPEHAKSLSKLQFLEPLRDLNKTRVALREAIRILTADVQLVPNDSGLEPIAARSPFQLQLRREWAFDRALASLPDGARGKGRPQPRLRTTFLLWWMSISEHRHTQQELAEWMFGDRKHQGKVNRWLNKALAEFGASLGYWVDQDDLLVDMEVPAPSTSFASPTNPCEHFWLAGMIGATNRLQGTAPEFQPLWTAAALEHWWLDRQYGRPRNGSPWRHASLKERVDPVSLEAIASHWEELLKAINGEPAVLHGRFTAAVEDWVLFLQPLVPAQCPRQATTAQLIAKELQCSPR